MKMVGLFLSSFLFSTVALAANDLCFEKAYSKDHLQGHKGQTLSDLRARLSSDGTLSLTGISTTDGKDYQFMGGDHIANTNLICASFSADGDDYEGCVNFEVSENAVKISPVAMSYVSSGQKMTSKGLELIRCEGRETDGEGCVSGLKKIVLSPKNAEDAVYVLPRVVCN